MDVAEGQAVGEPAGVGGGRGVGLGRWRCGGVEVGEVEQALHGRAEPRRRTGLVLVAHLRRMDGREEEEAGGRERGRYLLEAVEQGRGDVAQVQQEAEQRHGRPPTCVRLR